MRTISTREHGVPRRDGERGDAPLRGAHGAHVRPSAAPVPVDRRLRRLQLPRLSRRRPATRAMASWPYGWSSMFMRARPPSRRRARARMAQLGSDRRRRGASDVRRPAHRQAAAGASARRAVRRAARMGARRSVLPLPHEMDARARPAWRARPAGRCTTPGRASSPSRPIAAFVYTAPGVGTKRMYWKMSIDLSRPQVASMGHHDALDGLVACRTLAAASRVRASSARGRTRDR